MIPVAFALVLAVGAYAEEELPENVIARWGLGNPGILGISPDGTKIAMANNLGLRVFDIDGTNPVTMTDRRLDRIMFSPDGTMIAGGGQAPGPGVRGAWKVESGKPVLEKSGGESDFVGFSSDGELLFSVYRRHLRIWETGTGESFDHGYNPGDWKSGRPDDIAVSKSHSSLIAIARDDTIFTVDLRRLQTYENCVSRGEGKGRTCKGPYYILVSKLFPGKQVEFGGNLVAGVDSTNTVRIWDLFSGYTIRTIQHPTTICAIIFTHKGEIVIADETGAVLENGKRLSHSGIKSMSVLNDGTLATIGSDVVLWNPDSGHLIKKIEWMNQSVSGKITSVQFSPDGRTFASADRHGVVQIWDLDAKQLQNTFRINEEETDDWYFPVVRFSPDGRIIASIWDGDTVILRNLATGEILFRVQYPDNVTALEISPDGNMLAVGGRFHGVDLLNMSTGESFGNLETGRTASLAFSPSGDKLARGYDNISVWELPSRDLIMERGAGYETIVMKFSFDGRYLAAAMYYGSIRMIDISTGENLYPVRKNFGMGWRCTIGFSLDGLQLITGSGSRLIFRNAYNGETIKEIDTGEYSVYYMDISPDGKTMISGDWSQRIVLWRMPSVSVPVDFNSDGRVNLDDFFLLVEGFKTRDIRYDIDNDGKVGYTDYYGFRDAFQYYNE